jgi:hypothetical protein
VYNAKTGKYDGVCGIECAYNGIPSSNATIAYGQTRHAKGALLWLQWMWRGGEVPSPNRWLAASVGGDVCYGEGTYKLGAKTIKCALSSDVPGEAPVCPAAFGQCGGYVGALPFELPDGCALCPTGFTCVQKNKYYSGCNKNLLTNVETA